MTRVRGIKYKDADFFELAVRPLLQSKLQKSFFDNYLLDDDAALAEYVALEKYNTLNRGAGHADTGFVEILLN